MSIWSRISEALAALAHGEGLFAALERLRTPPEQSVAFTIAVIALGAKIAKADGLVTRDEVSAFRDVFEIGENDCAQVSRVYDLARQDVAGFDAYAHRVADMFAGNPDTLKDLLEGLFHIAIADGDYHPAENLFLREVAQIFGFSESEFACLRARVLPADFPGSDDDPYHVLGVPPDTPMDDIRAAWRSLVRENHPDRLSARGVPNEAVKLAEKRLIAVNRAWDMISGKSAPQVLHPA
ncbi:heat shock protein DnaJ-like protein [Ketogulonicigenium robustum]|uniref:Heat shock protein DnaJ-like protein n=1 Tax=Ketogulonicigenium robustum TaxID=92947 RepID=A0A1W6P196_9RHOB|nr:DnaJ family molecular chaperone [Ketogulonicigenium robustum]ARO15171.1 heat shock protein DnaJ-like protein [Ketogulonicigenium robustum]